MTRYRLRVSLVGSDPEIWRVFDIRGDLLLRMLHLALQGLIGWRESHLHAFTDTDPYTPGPQGRRWESSHFEPLDGALSEEEFTVDDVLGSIDVLWYEYDFGDGWIHRLDVIERADDDPHLAPVVLLDGAGHGPFEDSGGLHGYYEKLEIAADPQHPDHEFITDWIRVTVGPWAPQAFDLIGIQSELNLLFNPKASGYSPRDMSGLVKSDEYRVPGDVVEDSPIAELASALPPPIRSELRQHLHHAGLLEPTELDDETVARMIRPFGWLMDAVGTGGIALTSAGWMPPAVVLAGMTELGWLDDWIGKGNREDLTPPIAQLRESAQRMGLVRVQKGRLLLSGPAKKSLGDPRAQLRLIARGLYRKLGDAETDAATLLMLAIADGTPVEKRWEAVAFGLEMCGWASSTRQAFTARDIDHAIFHATEVLDLIGESSRRSRRRREDPAVVPFAAEVLR
ncbi:MAG: plasmid pRiA4b ORF-3 family protein [Microbacterium sp.]